MITHIWFETKPPKHVLDNGLPARLPPDEIFETCVPVAEVPDVAHVERLVRVLLSSGKIVKSRLNKDVPPVGYVARPGSPHGGHGLAQQEPLPVSSTYRILDSSSSTDSSTSAFSSTELLDERLAHRGRAGEDAEVDT